MNFDRTGIILYVINYQACIDFYGNMLGLKKMFGTEMLSCFEFGNAYLMVEQDTEFDSLEAGEARVRTCLRMNVPEVKTLADQLIRKGFQVDYQEHEWGTIAKFFDPDGNLCAFKDTERFENQFTEYSKKTRKN